MNEAYDNEDLIDKFIHDRLDEHECRKFKEKFKNDPVFQDDVFQQMKVMAALKTVKELQDKVFESDMEHLSIKNGNGQHAAIEYKLKKSITNSQEKNTSNKLRIRVFLAAASVSIISLVGIWLLIDGQKSNHEVLYANYYKPFLVEQTRYIQDSSEQINYLWKTFFNLYANKNYSEGVNKLNEILLFEPDNDIAYFYLGQCFLNKNEPSKAVSALSKVMGNIESVYYNDAIWYLSLVYLKMGNTSECEKLLNEIIAMQGFYAEMAINLKNDIKEHGN